MKSKTQSLLKSASKKAEPAKGVLYERDEGYGDGERCLYLLRRQEAIEVELKPLKELLARLIQGWREEQDLHCSSVIMPLESGTLQVVFKRQWGKIPIDREPELREEFGEDFDRCFARHVGLKLRKEIAEDPKALEKVITELGKAFGDRFATLFECEQTLAPTEDLADDPPIDAAARARLGLKQVITVSEKA